MDIIVVMCSDEVLIRWYWMQFLDSQKWKLPKGENFHLYRSQVFWLCLTKIMRITLAVITSSLTIIRALNSIRQELIKEVLYLTSKGLKNYMQREYKISERDSVGRVFLRRKQSLCPKYHSEMNNAELRSNTDGVCGKNRLDNVNTSTDADINKDYEATNNWDDIHRLRGGKTLQHKETMRIN